jgi:acetyl esterase/lipase
LSTPGNRSLLTTEDYRRLTIVPASRRCVYGAHPSQFGDLFLPDFPQFTAPVRRPVLVLIHGGCWMAAYGLEPLGQLAQAFTTRGVAVWSIEYRRLGDGGGWPDTFRDVGAATDFLRTLADEHALDLRRVVAAGHSAGGHLALWLAGRAHLAADSPIFTPNPLPVHGVVSIAGIPDLTAAAELAVCDDAILQLMGGVPDDLSERYASASPAALTPLGVPHVHVHGCKDAIVPIALVEAYVASAVQAGDLASLVSLSEAGHFEPVDAQTESCAHVLDAVLQLLARLIPQR